MADALEEKLARLKALHAQGLLTDEVYERQQSELVAAALRPPSVYGKVKKRSGRQHKRSGRRPAAQPWTLEAFRGVVQCTLKTVKYGNHSSFLKNLNPNHHNYLKPGLPSLFMKSMRGTWERDWQVKPADVFWLQDVSYGKVGKRGFVLTATDLICNKDSEPGWKLPYQDIQQVEVKTSLVNTFFSSREHLSLRFLTPGGEQLMKPVEGNPDHSSSSAAMVQEWRRMFLALARRQA